MVLEDLKSVFLCTYIYLNQIGHENQRIYTKSNPENLNQEIAPLSVLFLEFSQS